MSDFRDLALCRDFDPEIWFPLDERPESDGVREAAGLCALCPVREACLTWALESGQDFGVWGGLAPAERRALQRARKVPA